MADCAAWSQAIHDEPVTAPCSCSPDEGCRARPRGGCPRCGWTNTWHDSGDRGAAQHDHDRRCS